MKDRDNLPLPQSSHRTNDEPPVSYQQELSQIPLTRLIRALQQGHNGRIDSTPLTDDTLQRITPNKDA